MKTINYFIHAITSSFKHKIGSNNTTGQSQYHNVWTGKVWFEVY